MAVPGQVKTKANKKDFDKVRSGRQTEAQKKGTKAAKVASILIPGTALVKVSRLIATKGVAEATKKFGKNAVRAAQKYFNPVKTQKMKTGPGRGTPGNVKHMENAFVKFSKPTGTKSKKGLENMSMQKVTKSEGEKLARKGLARKTGLGTIATATAGTLAASGGEDKGKDKSKARDKGLSSLSGSGMDYSTKRKAERRTDRQSDASRTARPSGRTDSETVGKEQKERQAKLPPREGMGGKATVSPEQKSRQATLPKDSREDQIGVRIARMLGDKRSVSQMIRDREESDAMEEEMNYRKGGAVSKKYGMRAGGFTKRGGLYKKGY
jgi:hypothetical protein